MTASWKQISIALTTIVAILIMTRGLKAKTMTKENLHSGGASADSSGIVSGQSVQPRRITTDIVAGGEEVAPKDTQEIPIGVPDLPSTPQSCPSIDQPAIPTTDVTDIPIGMPIDPATLKTIKRSAEQPSDGNSPGQVDR